MPDSTWRSVASHWPSIREGFYSFGPQDAIQYLDAEMVIGVLDGATDLLKEVLRTLTELDLKRFLLFVTAQPSLPVLKVRSKQDELPSAPACFWMLKIPEYESVEVMRAKLITAIREGGAGFGLS